MLEIVSATFMFHIPRERYCFSMFPVIVKSNWTQRCLGEEAEMLAAREMLMTMAMLKMVSAGRVVLILHAVF